MSEATEASDIFDNLDLLGRYILKDGIDLNNRIILLDYMITSKSAGKFLKGLKFLESYSSSPITIQINCPGGNVYDGLAIIDAINSSPCAITTVGTGLVASMAVPILSSGKIRKLSENAFCMFHEISYGNPLDRLSTNESEGKHSKILNARLCKILAATTRKPYHFWARVGKHLDYYMDADKALELGLVDEIVGSHEAE